MQMRSVMGEGVRILVSSLFPTAPLSLFEFGSIIGFVVVVLEELE